MLMEKQIEEMPEGTRKQLTVFEDRLPVTIIRGKQKGKTVVITAGMHSGEYPGIPALIALCQKIDPDQLCGTLIAFHCLNDTGLYEHTDALFPEDGKNLNRIFPGKADGTITERMADFFVREVCPCADFIIDLHSGGFAEPLVPCIFYPADEAVKQESLAVAEALTNRYLLPSYSTVGGFSYAANVMHIPGILVERGYSGLCPKEWISAYEEDLKRALSVLGMISYAFEKCEHTLITEVCYMEFEENGIWHCEIQAGGYVEKGSVLGTVTDLFGDPVHTYYAETSGIVMYHRGGIAAETGGCLAAIAVC